MEIGDYLTEEQFLKDVSKKAGEIILNLRSKGYMPRGWKQFVELRKLAKEEILEVKE